MMLPLTDLILSTAALLLLSSISMRSFRFWEQQPGVRRLPARALEVAIGGTIFLLLNLSVIFFDDAFSRPAVCLIAAGTYYAFARLCASMGSSVWGRKHFHSLAFGGLILATASLFFTPLSTPLVVLIFIFLTHWEQWRFIDTLNRESSADLISLRIKMRTIRANLHNNSITSDVEDDNLDAAG